MKRLSKTYVRVLYSGLKTDLGTKNNYGIQTIVTREKQ